MDGQGREWGRPRIVAAISLWFGAAKGVHIVVDFRQDFPLVFWTLALAYLPLFGYAVCWWAPWASLHRRIRSPLPALGVRALALVPSMLALPLAAGAMLVSPWDSLPSAVLILAAAVVAVIAICRVRVAKPQERLTT